MPWIKIPGLEGLVYEPQPSGRKKHNCKDCFSCQMCSDERCSVCRGEATALSRTDNGPDCNCRLQVDGKKNGRPCFKK